MNPRQVDAQAPGALSTTQEGDREFCDLAHNRTSEFLLLSVHVQHHHLQLDFSTMQCAPPWSTLLVCFEPKGRKGIIFLTLRSNRTLASIPHCCSCLFLTSIRGFLWDALRSLNPWMKKCMGPKPLLSMRGHCRPGREVGVVTKVFVKISVTKVDPVY